MRYWENSYLHHAIQRRPPTWTLASGSSNLTEFGNFRLTHSLAIGYMQYFWQVHLHFMMGYLFFLAFQCDGQHQKLPSNDGLRKSSSFTQNWKSNHILSKIHELLTTFSPNQKPSNSSCCIITQILPFNLYSPILSCIMILASSIHGVQLQWSSKVSLQGYYKNFKTIRSDTSKKKWCPRFFIQKTNQSMSI